MASNLFMASLRKASLLFGYRLLRTLRFFDRSILIRVAEIGFGRPPDFEVMAPGEPSMTQRIDYALRNHPKFIEAFEEESHEGSRSNGVTKEFFRLTSRRRGRKMSSKL